MQSTDRPALRKHFLASITPVHLKQSSIQPTPQFIKNRQFYKPQQFIWNNPHRTSKKMYPYYHKLNEQYQKNLKPYHQYLQQKDRITAQQMKIQKLTQIRKQIRDKFSQRIAIRNDLQMKTSRRKRISTISTSIENPESNAQLINKAPSLKNKLNTFRQKSERNQQGIQSYRLSVGEQTLLESLKKYNEKGVNLNRIVNRTLDKNNQNAKSLFINRKQSLKNSDEGSNYFMTSSKQIE